MKAWGVLGRFAATAVALLCLGTLVPGTAEGATWRVAGGDVRITVGLRPGGSFVAKTSSLEGELTPGTGAPLTLAGKVAVSLTGIDTGIDLRNDHLREKLEVSRGQGFDQAVLSEIVLEKAADASFEGKTPFSASMLLHGVSKAVTGTAEIRPAGRSVRVDAELVLSLRDFDVEPPSYMGVGVTDRVVVKVAFAATAVGGRN